MLSCGEQKIGNIIILGGKTTIDLVSKDVMSLLDAKGETFRHAEFIFIHMYI